MPLIRIPVYVNSATDTILFWALFLGMAIGPVAFFMYIRDKFDLTLLENDTIVAILVMVSAFACILMWLFLGLVPEAVIILTVIAVAILLPPPGRRR